MMARYPYTGRLTNAQRIRFAASLNAQLVVRPQQPGYGETGLISDRDIPVTVDPADGRFTVYLESSRSVRPLMLYEFGMTWQEGGTNPWSSWYTFLAAEGGGAIGDMVQLPPNNGTWTYGWGTPEENGVHTGLYVDLETGQWYGEERAVR